MKTGFTKNFFWLIVPMAVVIAGLIVGHSSSNSEAQAAASASAQNSTVAPTPPPTTTDNSPAQNILPPNILPASPLAEVIKLSQAGVGESVIMAYVTNSGSTFNLDSDKIIYLADAGVANEVVAAMMQHDQLWQQQMTAASAPQPDSTPAPNPNDTSDAPQTAEPEQVTINYFNTALAPYGNWVDVPGYGRCWRPTGTYYDAGWQPYCDRGHWVNTDCGWYWDSDYAWGATFHYGRWFRDTRFGWCWWPDTVWAPSWVTWRSGEGFCGWAPLPPFAVIQPGIGFVYEGNGVSAGFNFGLSSSCYTFVPTANFCDVRLRNHRFAPTQVTQIFNHTTVINNININNHTVFNHGLTVQQIAAAVGKPIREISARDLRTARHEVRNATFNPPNHNSNNRQAAPAFERTQNEQTQVPVATTHNPQERNRNVPDAQQHFTPGEHLNAPVSTENSAAGSDLRREHFDQNRTGTRDNSELRQKLNEREQKQNVEPAENHAPPPNQSPGNTHSEPAGGQSRPQAAQAAPASQSDKGGKQNQTWPR